MCACDEVSILRSITEDTPMLLLGLGTVDVISDRDGRIDKLHCGDMDDIAPKEQLFAFAFHFVHRMTRSMPVGRLGPNSWDQIGTPSNVLILPAVM